MATGQTTRNYVANPGELPGGTLVELFFDAVDKYGKPDALLRKSGGAWQPWSHARILEEVRLAALALQAMGIDRGDRLAILSENRPEWALADYATLCLGAWDVPIYPTLPASQIAYLLNNSGARLIFVSTAEQLHKIRSLRTDTPGVQTIVVFDDVAAGSSDVITWRQLLELGQREQQEGKGEGFRERALATRPQDVATLLYTSGTTGEPKGVMLTHGNIASNVQAAAEAFDVGPSDVALSLLPLSHIFERTVSYLLFSRGVTIAYAESIEAVPANLLEVRPTLVASVPRLYEKIHARVLAATGVKRRLVNWAAAVGNRRAAALLAGRQPPAGTRMQYALADRLVFSKLRERTGGRLRFFISGGAPLSLEIAKFFYSAGILILEGYGLSETSPVTNVNTPSEFRFGTVGKPVRGTEIMLAEDGEILVRGPQVMNGYYGKPEATAEAIDADGWFHTGDVGEIDQDGYLRITDRKKDLIVTAGGKNIAPQPIENRVKLNRYVAEAVMIGDRRPYPVLLIVPDFEALKTWIAQQSGIAETDRSAILADPRVRRLFEDEVLGMLTDLARFERPKRIALLEHEFSVDTGELTPTLKVRRRVVEDRHRAVIEALYEQHEPVAAE
jgi:long-chain acyl-CoA synthetase